MTSGVHSCADGWMLHHVKILSVRGAGTSKADDADRVATSDHHQGFHPSVPTMHMFKVSGRAGGRAQSMVQGEISPFVSLPRS